MHMMTHHDMDSYGYASAQKNQEAEPGAYEDQKKLNSKSVNFTANAPML